MSTCLGCQAPLSALAWACVPCEKTASPIYYCEPCYDKTPHDPRRTFTDFVMEDVVKSTTARPHTPHHAFRKVGPTAIPGVWQPLETDTHDDTPQQMEDNKSAETTAFICFVLGFFIMCFWCAGITFWDSKSRAARDWAKACVWALSCVVGCIVIPVTIIAPIAVSVGTNVAIAASISQATFAPTPFSG